MTIAQTPPTSTGMTWIVFALLTVATWGVYGVLLHKGQMQMAPPGTDPNARYKAFLFVGIAYFLTAILAPLAILLINGATWKFSGPGMTYSLLAGIVGAIGAFCVLLAFGAAPKPTFRYVPVVMSIIFAGAPIVNAVVSTTIEGNWSGVKWQFMLGVALAAAGGCMVVLFKPDSH